MKINIGIIFGGPSRQREQSFLNARSLFTNLDRQLFEPVPIFADSRKRLYLADWKILFRKSLADFFPGPENAPPSEAFYPIYEESFGDQWEQDIPPALRENTINPEALPQLLNFAFIALCGTPEEDAWAHTLLESLRIPYAGHGLVARRHFARFADIRGTLAEKGFGVPDYRILDRAAWKEALAAAIRREAVQNLGSPIKIFSTSDPLHWAWADEGTDLDGFCEAVETGFYEEQLPLARWQEMSMYERGDYLRLLADLRLGLGFPVYAKVQDGPGSLVYHPQGLMQFLNTHASDPALENRICYLSSTLPSGDVVLEAVPAGKTFSVTVLPSEEGPLVLHPITQQGNSSLPGSTNGEWSECLFSGQESETIRNLVTQVAIATELNQVFTVSGKISPEGRVIFEYIATGFSFLPGNPLFLSAAQVGLLPCEWLTALFYFSLRTRISENPSEISWRGLLAYFMENLAAKKPAEPVGILYTSITENQYRPESAEQIVQFLGAEGSFRPVLLLIEYRNGAFHLRQQLPVPLLREEASEANLQVLRELFLPGPVLPSGTFTLAQLSRSINAVFLDIRNESLQGLLQRELKSAGIAFNGPGPAAAGVAGHPFLSMEALRRNTDLVTCGQLLIHAPAFASNPGACVQRIESRFPYPLLGISPELGALPIYRREELEAFIRLLFRPEGATGEEFRKILRFKRQFSIPVQKEILFQEIVRPLGARKLLPLTVPVIGTTDADGTPAYLLPGPEERFGERSNYNFFQNQDKIHLDQLDQALQSAIADSSNKAAETAARVLNLQGAVCVDLTMRVYDNGHSEPVVENLELFPEWKLSGPIVRALIRQGEFPGNIPADILRDSIARPHIEQLALAARTEHISASVPATGALTFDPGTPIERQAHNQVYSMENTPTPSQRSRIEDIRNLLPASGITGIVQEWLLNFWHFISSRIFLKNLGAAAVFIFLLLNVVSAGLKLYTNHGQAIEVGNYQGMTVREARREARSQSFTTLVNDSIYIVGKQPGIILDQVPRPGSKIKKNRYIYLTVSSATPPNISLPSLIGGNDDFDQYRKKLERLGIKARIKDREFNAELEDNTILYLIFKGKRIEPSDLKKGVKVPKGSTIEVIVSIRNTGTVDIPDLVCKTYEEAIFLLQSSQLTVGSVFAPGEPLPWHYVYKQEPDFDPVRKLSVGEGINLFLTEEKPANCKE